MCIRDSRYVDTYLASLQRIAAVRPNLLLTSHYPVYEGAAAAEFMAESHAFVDRVDQALIKALASERTLKEMTDLLAPDLGAYACFPFLGHLERLVQYGHAQTDRRDGLLTYRLK